MRLTVYLAGLILLVVTLSNANATIINGSVTIGTGIFIKLSPGFTDSIPDNTVGDDNFQTPNLYGFDEDQNTTVTGSALNVDILAGNGGVSGTLSVGTVVASHYVFFDPDNLLRQVGWVDFDSEILAIITSTDNLADSDYLANTGINYENPTLRGLESGDLVSIDAVNSTILNVDWRAGTPGDYVRVLTAFSPGAAIPIPEPATLVLMGLGLVGISCRRKKKET